jgi:uncharacterized protein YdeI (YjbR/CyaY-like superfamily)
MTQSRANPDLDAFFVGAKSWRAEFTLLREILLEAPLDELRKWGWPCYASGGGNLVLMHGFKTYCALLFFKGALLKDPADVLVQQTANVQAGRQMRFTSSAQILASRNVISSYVFEAIELEESGAMIKFKTVEEFEVPEEFQARLEAQPELKAAFSALSPGRRKAYLLHFADAKQSKTRQARIEKALPSILAGQGLDD